MSRKTDPAKFIEIWQTSSSIEEVAERMRVTLGAVKQRERSYRKHKVPLKFFGIPARPYNWISLRSYARKLLKSRGKARKIQPHKSRSKVKVINEPKETK